MALDWDSVEDLSAQLLRRFPDVDPLTIRFPDLQRWVSECDGFEGGPRPDSPRALEAIQRAWYARYES